MDLLHTILSFIIAIFILVTAHEFGHFITAKIFGMRVDRFYIGFDFFGMRLWKKKIGETEYGIGLFPVGGYVKIAGMIDESLDTGFQNTKPEPWEFRAKPVWQRLIVLAGGVGMNMILAAMIFTGITAIFGESRTSLVNPAYVDPSSVFASMGIKTGDRFTEINGKPAQSWEEALNPELFTARSLQYTLLRNGQAITVSAPSDILTRLNAEKTPGVRPLMPPIIDEVLRNQPAAKAGLKPGALVTMINGKEVLDWTEVVGIISSNPGKQITITWKYLNQPDGKQLTAEMIRSGGETFVSTVVPGNSGKIGISLKQTLETQRRKLNAFESVQSGVGQTWKTTVMTVQGFAKMFSGKEDFRKSVGGPIKIARIAGQSAEQGPVSFFYFVAVLSISLAFINILPVPALDGGQFLLNGIEGIIRRDIPFAVKMRIQQVGMAILMTLFVYFIINDIFNP